MTLSDIRKILSERELRLSKSLGQNFLHDQNQVRRILAAAEAGPGDKILEIGPGLGPLTEALLQKGCEVLAIEKDQRLFDFLQQKFAAASHLQLLRDDALDYLKTHRSWGGWKLVSNLPYSAGSSILVELAQAEDPPERMAATLQIEVAARIAAGAGSPHYGILGLLVQLRFQSAGCFKIPPSCFFPEPDVDSACVTLVRRPVPLLQPERHPLFVALVKRAFSQRRKMMFKLLKQNWPEARLAEAFRQLALSPQIRAEAVRLEQFVRLAEILGRVQTQPPLPEEIFDIVNDNDEVIGQLPRRIVHRDGHKHRAVHVLVFDSRGRIFLQKRSLSQGHLSRRVGFLRLGPFGERRGLRRLRRARTARRTGLERPRPAPAAVQNRRLRRNRPGICLGLALRVRRPLYPAPGRNRARRLVHPGGSQPLAGPKPAGLRPILRPDLEEMGPRSWRHAERCWQEKLAIRVSEKVSRKS